MSNTSVGRSGNGIGIGTILFLIFLVLKLTHYIDWSWWWVFSPLWIPVVVVVVMAGLAALLGGVRRR